MVARRSDNRRRRIFVESGSPETTLETTALPTGSSSERGKGRPNVLYTPGAERRHQHKTTDLIPKRFWAVVSMIGGLVLIVIALNLIAYYSPKWEPSLGAESVDALRLTGRGTIAAWFSSMLFIVSGLASLQIYALRQHRRDDYRGSFRIWLWMSALLILASANCVIDLGSIAMQAVQSWLQSTPSPSAGIYWIFAVKMLLLSLLIARGIFEIRESRATLTIVALVWAAYLGASVLQLPNSFNAINQLTVQQQEIFTGNLQIVAVIGIFLAHLVFARFIYMQATGLIKLKEKKITTTKPKKNPVAKPVAKSERLKSTATSPMPNPGPHTGSEELEDQNDTEREMKPDKGVPAQTKRVKQPQIQLDRAEEQEENESILSMSKAERRRHRKSPKQSRRAA